jgi:hypothetical protein
VCRRRLEAGRNGRQRWSLLAELGRHEWEEMRSSRRAGVSGWVKRRGELHSGVGLGDRWAQRQSAVDGYFVGTCRPCYWHSDLLNPAGLTKRSLPRTGHQHTQNFVNCFHHPDRQHQLTPQHLEPPVCPTGSLRLPATVRWRSCRASVLPVIGVR